MTIHSIIPKEIDFEENQGKEVPFFLNEKEIGVSKIVELAGHKTFETHIFPQFAGLIEIQVFGNVQEQKDGKVTKMFLESCSICLKK